MRILLGVSSRSTSSLKLTKHYISRGMKRILTQICHVSVYETHVSTSEVFHVLVRIQTYEAQRDRTLEIVSTFNRRSTNLIKCETPTQLCLCNVCKCPYLSRPENLLHLRKQPSVLSPDGDYTTVKK